MTKRNITYLVIAVIVLASMPFLNAAGTTYACSPVDVENWWYAQQYEFDRRQLPTDVDVQVVYERSEIGQLVFSNQGDDDWYIVFNNYNIDTASLLSFAHEMPFNGDELLARGIDSERLLEIADGTPIDPVDSWIQWSGKLALIDPESARSWINQHHPEAFIPLAERKNVDDAGGITDAPPDPQQSALIFVNQNDFYAVPYTITYRINDAYEPNMIVPPTTIKDTALAANAIIRGHAPLADHPRVGEMLDSKSVIGPATFHVDEWIKGDGPDVIQVDEFGYGTDCRPGLYVDETVIVFLGKKYTEDHYRVIETWGWYGQTMVSPQDAPEVYEALNLSPPVSDINETARLLWGVLFIVFLLVIGFSMRFRRKQDTSS